MMVTKQLLVAIDFHSIEKNTKESQWLPTSNCLVTKVLQNIFFCVQQKKEIHIRTKRVWVYDEFSFLG